jgi:2-C-methyl-D-erythritol 4-phosphate cytidylyltransferase
VAVEQTKFPNFKITTKQDFELARQILKLQSSDCRVQSSDTAKT